MPPVSTEPLQSVTFLTFKTYTPFSAPVCHALRTSVESAPNLETDPLRRSSDAGICNPDMESPARQNNGEKFRTEPSIHSTPRVIQRPASNRQQPRLT